MKTKIVQGDTVEVITGEDKGYQGEVQRVIRKKDKHGHYDPNRVYVIVAGANIVVKHQRPTGRVRTQTGRIEREAPMHISNVMLVAPDGEPTRVSYEVADNDEKSRVARGSREPLPKPTE